MDATRLLAALIFLGHTPGMKAVISISDDLFADAERLARPTKKSRSRLFTDALKEYLARHSPEEIIDAMNKALAEVGRENNRFPAAAARRSLERSEW